MVTIREGKVNRTWRGGQKKKLTTQSDGNNGNYTVRETEGVGDK